MKQSFETGPDDVRRGQGKRAILIAGPTASGKSALAIDLAKSVGGVVVNADSMQLYKELRLVSARPSAEEEAVVPHRLYGVLPAAEVFSTGAWLRRVEIELADIWAQGQVPVLVGGTGLYFKALLQGLAELPEIPQQVRSDARAIGDAGGAAALKEALAAAGDPEAAASLEDPQRLARALEVIQASGKTLAHWQAVQPSQPVLDSGDCVSLVLGPPRAWLHERIARRAKGMLSADGLREVEILLSQKLSYKLPAMRAIGVKEIGAFLSGDQDLEETEYRLIVATRQYAKRQETWFRNQMPDWQRIDPSKEIDLTGVLGRFAQSG